MTAGRWVHAACTFRGCRRTLGWRWVCIGFLSSIELKTVPTIDVLAFFLMYQYIASVHVGS